ncbi:GCG_CRPN prefix-to-repeats domain-containing protein [Bradyrhizobium sp. UFLA05-112]
MKYLLAAIMLAGVVVGFSEAASAAGGCGPGWYRGPYGGCRPMGRTVMVAPAPVVVAPVVVARPRVCPWGFRWWAGRCRPV